MSANATLWEYAATRRLLPLLAVTLVTTVVAAIASYIMSCLCRQKSSGNGRQQEDRQCVPVVAEEARHQSRHVIKTGRPNLLEIVSAMSSGENRRGKVVRVCACGPNELVKSVERVVKTTRKKCKDVRVEFEAFDSSW